MKRSLGTVLFFVVLLWLAPLLSTQDPLKTNPENILAAPDSNHIFGTDNLGRDILSRTLYGGQRTILTATLASFISVSIGLTLAILLVISPTAIQIVLNAILNSLLAFPVFVLSLVILTTLGRGLLPIAIATGLAQMPFYARVAYGILARQKTAIYIEAAQAAGASPAHIVWNHYLRNTGILLSAYAAVTFSYSIINSAGLSLLGLGGDPSLPDWGVMLATGRETFRFAPWAIIAPGLAISLTVIFVNKWVDSLNNHFA